jgi:hypothetical protein
MHRVSIFRSHAKCRRGLLAFCLAPALSLSQGCARSEPVHPAEEGGTVAAAPQLPFHPGETQASADAPATAPDAKPAKGLPFRLSSETRVLPAGTLLTVQLQDSLLASHVHGGDVFSALIADPVVKEGETVIERGSEVRGLVEAAQSRAGSGYVRLTLSAITVEGISFALQTSSLFARATARESSISSGGSSSHRLPGGVRIQKGRRLTFRLTAPVTLDDSISQNRSKSAGIASE